MAEGLGVEAGCDGDPTSIAQEQFEVGSGGGGGGDGIGEDGDGEEVVVGTGGGTMVAGGGLGRVGLVEVFSEGMEGDCGGGRTRLGSGRCGGNR